ncbi:MAG: cation-translocating P-type ATPase [Eubacteriales bacterium]|nr:cation-translocating P-type ATPase [Eubacteriales bacterium]
MSENCCHSDCCGHKHGFFNSMKYRLWVLIVAAVLCVVSYFWDDIIGDSYETGKYFNPAWLVVIICGGPLIVDGFRKLFKEKRVGTSLLISVAIFACIALEILCWCGVALDDHSGGHDHSNLFSAAEVAFIMWLGDLLEDFAVAKLTKNQTTLNHDHGHSHRGEVKKTRIERTVDKWAGIIVPSAIVIAAVVFVLVLTVFTEDWHVALTRAMTVLVVFCPCSLVLSTPTAIVAGLRNLSSKNIVIKNGSALERVAKTDVVVLDTDTDGYDLKAILAKRNTEVVSFSADADAGQKVEEIGRLKRDGRVVCYVGDSDKESAAFSAADVSMLTGSGENCDFADINLGGGTEKVDGILRFGKRVLATITANIILAVSVNIVSVVLSLFGYLDPVIGALVHNGGTILVVINSAFLLAVKKPFQSGNSQQNNQTGEN